MKTDTEKTNDAKTFLLNNISGVISTVTEEGSPQSALVFYVAREDFSIIIATLKGTHKYRNIEHNNRVAFTVANIDVPQTVQLEGRAHIMTDEQEVLAATADLVPLFTRNSTYAAPLAKMEDGKLDLIKIEPEFVRWYDYAYAEDGDMHLIDFVTQ